MRLRIALCAVQIPFVRGGAESLCDNLYAELCRRNYEVEYIKIPFKWYPPQNLVTNALAWRLLDLTESNGSKIDGVITTKFPSYLVRHDKKVVWLLHQHRPAYDLAHTRFDDLATYGTVGEIVRRKIRRMDEIGFKESKKVYTISQNVANRLWSFNRLHGEVLYHPPPLMGRYRCGDYGDYIFYPSRLDPVKRQDLVIKAMKYVHRDLKLVISGTGALRDQYMAIARAHGVADRVDFTGYVSDEELLELYSNALCVVYTPVDEDLGYVTMESFLSKKPVITCNDSGGALEFVRDGENGYVVNPSPEEIAERINILYEGDRVRAMGENGYRAMGNMNLSWDHVIDSLLEPLQ